MTYIPVYGNPCCHYAIVVFNFLLGLYFTRNCWCYKRELVHLVHKVLHIPQDNSASDSAVSMSFFELAATGSDSTIKVRSILGTFMIAFSAFSCFLGCLELLLARRFLHDKVLLSMFEDVRVREQELAKVKERLVKVEDRKDRGQLQTRTQSGIFKIKKKWTCWHYFWEKDPDAPIEESIPKCAMVRLIMGLLGGVLVSVVLLLICLYNKIDLGVYVHFIMPWLWSAWLRRPVVHVVWCMLEIGKARVHLFIKELEGLAARDVEEGLQIDSVPSRASRRHSGVVKCLNDSIPLGWEGPAEETNGSSQRGKKTKGNGKKRKADGYFTDKTKDYWKLEEDLCDLCSATHSILRTTLPTMAFGAYLFVLATFMTDKPGFKFASVVLCLGYVLSIIELLWPFGQLSDCCCISLKEEILGCSELKMTPSQTAEYLKLAFVSDSKPIGANLPFVGYITTNSLLFFGKFALTTLPASIALASQPLHGICNAIVNG